MLVLPIARYWLQPDALHSIPIHTPQIRKDARTGSRIFQFKKVPDIISEVLGKYGFPLTLKIIKTYREWDYCVQYQETDLAFVMRLMEHEGIYFYFEHQEGKHTLVLADDASCHAPLAGKPSIKYLGVDVITVANEEHFFSWEVLENISSGEYITDDYDFEKPRADLKTQRKNPLGHAHDSWERYTWPGGYVKVGDGENYTGVRLESLEGEYERTRGQTSVRTMACGYRFNLERCPRADQNREYLAQAVTYFFRDNTRMSKEGDSTWEITVTAHPTALPYRPQVVTAKPLTHGPQTALVVGPPGEEIYTDNYGRVKVQFFWDRYGQKNENSSCWIRVSHPWAGSKFGVIHTPRIGQEVIVDFMGGDPDYPMITGRVYNADQMPPWDLPGNKTQSGILTRSSKGGAPGAGIKDGPGSANALRFEDKKGAEQLWLHAEKDQLTEVENDEDKWVGRDRRKTVDRDELNHIQRDRTETVDRNELINVHGWRTEEVDKDETITIHQNRTERVDLNEKISIGKNQNLKIGINRDEAVGSNETTQIGKNKSDKVGNNWSLKTGKMKTETIGIANIETVGMARMTNIGMGLSVNVGLMMNTIVGIAQSSQIGQEKKLSVGETYATTVGKTRTTEVGETDSLQVGKTQNISVGERQQTSVGKVQITSVGEHLELSCGAAKIVLTADGGIYLSGTHIEIIGSTAVHADGGMVQINTGAAQSAPAAPAAGGDGESGGGGGGGGLGGLLGGGGNSPSMQDMGSTPGFNPNAKL